MSLYLEARKPSGAELILLHLDHVAVGSSPSSDLVVAADAKVSRVHAVLERIASRWFVRDLGSRNGTFVNGQRIMAECPLRSGDELRFGSSRFVFRGEEEGPPTATETDERGPELTRRETDVLVSLCRPLYSGDFLTEPATVKQIAADLVLTESAVKKHLQRLYDKFGIESAAGSRRGRLANEALRRGAVSLSDLRGT